MDKSKWMPWLIAAGISFFISLIYFLPEIQGKVLERHDGITFGAASHEINEFREEHGEEPLWTGRMFSGMPTYFISFVSPANFFSYANQAFKLFIGGSIGTFFILIFGFYFLLRVMGVNHWLAIAGGVLYAFSSYFVILVQAGHATKLVAIAYAAPVLGGIIMTYRRNLWLGLALTALFTCMEIYANHIQITYYLFMAIVIFAVSEAIRFISKGETIDYFKRSVFLILAAAIGLAPNFSKLWTVYDASKETIRGGKSELTPITEEGKAEKKSDGLTKDYAYQWSYGIGETMTLAFPHAAGGASKESLDTESNTYEALIKAGVDRRMAKNFVEGGMPTYWGAQPFTSGPTFIGIVSILLVVLGFFTLKKDEMLQLGGGLILLWVFHLLRGSELLPVWLYFLLAVSLALWLIFYFASRQKDFAWLSIVTVLFIMLSWGKNLQWFSDFFFDNLPMYNKFRAPSMALVMVEFCVPLLGILSLNSIIKQKNILTDKRLYAGVGLVALVALFIATQSDGMYDFNSTSDASFLNQLTQSGFPQQKAQGVVEALRSDRMEMLSSDGWSAFGFIILVFGAIYFWKKDVIKTSVLGILVGFIGIIELVKVDTNYLSHDDYVAERKYKDNFDASPADQLILQDPNYFRVLNFTVSTFNDATTSYHHHSVGGYSAAKLQLYQDLIERHIGQNNQKVWSMLNTKYIIQDPRQPSRFPNLGPLWNVESLRWVDNADEEIEALNDFEPALEMVADKRYKDTYENWDFEYDSLAMVEFVEYQPNLMTYSVEASKPQLVVFSEIFYKGNEDWKSYVDGKEVPHFRCNYALRGMLVPAGKHKIEFRFDPRTFRVGERVSFAGSLSLLALLIFGIFRFVKEEKSKQNAGE
jgi:hypothetical protein